MRYFPSLLLAAVIFAGGIYAQGRQLLFPGGTAERPGLAVELDKKTGVFMKDATTLAFAVNGVEAVTVGRSGILTGGPSVGPTLTGITDIKFPDGDIFTIADENGDQQIILGGDLFSLSPLTFDTNVLVIGSYHYRFTGDMIAMDGNDVQYGIVYNGTLATSVGPNNNFYGFYAANINGGGHVAWAYGRGTGYEYDFYSTGTTFSNLSAPPDGTMTYCSDCTISATCAGSGTGAWAKRLNSTWVCN